MKTFAVITPTIGAETLRDNILSLRGQNCRHYIIMDGQENFAKINKIMVEVGITHQTKIITLEENVGKGWYGHRVYAAASFLVNEDVLCYLDEDNVVQPDYIEEFQKVFAEDKYAWAYTLRNIVDSTGRMICQDNCESLGHWAVEFDRSRHHIDTGCFAIPRELAVKVGHNWYGQWGADRQFFAAVKAYAPEFGCTMKHTLNYRMGSETSRATTDMFLQGNSIAKTRYLSEENYPWHVLRNQRKLQTQFTYQTTNPNPQ